MVPRYNQVLSGLSPKAIMEPVTLVSSLAVITLVTRVGDEHRLKL